jgi:(1->4)-alpha-D-glucan 1-alpha-D-glucosylmutase
VSPDVRATYRVQLHKDFGFDAAAAVVPYLAELGISHLYCSPYLQARSGSTHGYDVVDQSRVSEELGGTEAHRRLIAVLAEHGMSHILDVVPNHMTVTDRANAWWWDVLRNGHDSHYASYFDIDWDPPEDKLFRTILVPILGDHYGRALQTGDIKLERENHDVLVRYFEHVLPTSPGSVEVEDLDAINSDADALHEVLERQHYRLAYWRSAGQELNYRRFFSINDLAALRMDNPDVFDQVHRLPLELVRSGDLEGLRVDHIDGLRDPEGYLNQLRSWAPEAYLIVEKILEPSEELPRDWPIQGTTGYEFLNRVYGLFVDPLGEQPMTSTYEAFIGERLDVEELRREKKLLLMETELAADVERLLELFAPLCEQNRNLRDFTRVQLRDSLRETIACFPVYRTYVSPARPKVAQRDREYVAEATGLASKRRPELSDLFQFLQEILLLRERQPQATELALRFQQTTGPVMAKGVEDTVFYIYNRFVGLNEVGGDPGTFGISPARFHAETEAAQRDWAQGMLASSTHDTKRSEDVRARLALLSEIPDRWRTEVGKWRDLNDEHRSGAGPDRNMEYLLYQTLVGAWPLSTERALAYVEKAAREAKIHTSWTDPDEDYETALEDFVRSILEDERFTRALESFVRPLIAPGRVNALSQQLIKLTSPGVPDIYQGTETWDHSLVDPDNRRPVDYDTRAELLRVPSDMTAPDDDHVGASKLHLTRVALQLRARLPHAFGPHSSYRALSAWGEKANHVVAFQRGDEVVVVVPRLVLGLGGDWKDTALDLPDGTWVDELGGGSFQGSGELPDLLSVTPVALLAREGR